MGEVIYAFFGAEGGDQFSDPAAETGNGSQSILCLRCELSDRQQGRDHLIDAEGTRANRIAEIAVTQTMVERVRCRFDPQPQRLTGDTAYGAVRLLKWLVDRQITPHIPVLDKSARSDGTFSRADFVFDRSRNIYICPNGRLLHTTGTIIDGSTLRYRASKFDCDACAFKMKCCPHTPARRCLAIFMKTPAISPVHWPIPRLSNNHAGSAKRSRCGLRTSSASCGSTGCDCEA